MMTRAGAILGSVAGGCLAVGLLYVSAAGVFAQEFGGPGGGPQGGDMVSASETGPGGGLGIGDLPGGPPAAPGALGSARALIDTLNKALENALARGHSRTADAAPVPPPPPADAMALAARQGPAARGPVVVELFTSQGCSSCPPADELFEQLAARPDVIALALHVDYWDYLGWEDPFAQPAFTARQKAYAVAAHSRSIYTPQMMVEGSQSLIGADGRALDGLIAQEKARPAQVALTVSGGEGRYTIDLTAPAPLAQQTVVQIVRFAPQARVAILRGENAGMVIDYANVVTAWHAVADWDGQTPTRLTARIEGDQPAVVIVQSVLPGKSGPLPGPILAAARMN